MNLSEFVTETLTEILAGVRKAQDTIAPMDGRHGVINPTWNDQSDLADHLQTVKFDVAVTVSDQATRGGKGGIKVMSLEIGGNAEQQQQNKTVSRISFSVPILPSTTVVAGVNKPQKRPTSKK